MSTSDPSPARSPAAGADPPGSLYRASESGSRVEGAVTAIDKADSMTDRPALRRELGLREALAVGIGGTVGGGIFTLIGNTAGVAGPAALISFVLAFVATGLVALPYAELACRLPKAGGGYAYAREVLGERWGFAMGWVYWGGYVLASGYVTVGFGGYLKSVTGLPTTVGAVALVALCLVVNLFGLKVSGWAQTLVFFVALAGFVAFSAWGVFSVDPGMLHPFAPEGALGVLLAAPAAFLSFGGFDMVAAAGEEVKRPERNLPLAIFGTLTTVLALYLVVALVAFGTTSTSVLGASGSPLADAAAAFGGQPARALIVGCALLTLAATANGMLLVTSRAMFAMSRDGLLPGVLGRTREGSPLAALLVCGALLIVVALVGDVNFAATAGGFLYILHFVPPLIALAVLRRRERRDRTQRPPSFRVPMAKLVVPLAFVCCAVLLATTGLTGVVVGGGWLALGGVAFALQRARGPRSRTSP